MTSDTFAGLDLSKPVLRALEAEGYDRPTPIQQQTIPWGLKGRDILGCAQTGTGKTAAFALPIIDRLSAGGTAAPHRPRAMVLTPTRELAAQIGDNFGAYARFTRIKRTVIFGGVNQKPQVSALARRVDVLIATPGRLIDLLEQGHVHLDAIEIVVLDEADRMLDMGFIHDVKRILKHLPRERQSLLFSATMPDSIARLADSLLDDPVKVAVAPVSSTADRIDQRVLFVRKGDKRALLGELLQDPRIARALVFSRTKRGANRIAKQLGDYNVEAEAIHGNKSQNARLRALNAFRAGRVRVLVATDIAARGIDVEGVTHVINYDLPNEPESYVHRIGRTARAGAEGAALSFCDAEERPYLRSIEKLVKQRIPVFKDHPHHVQLEDRPSEPKPPARGRNRRPLSKRPRNKPFARKGRSSSVSAER